MLTEAELEQIAARAEAAPVGPWLDSDNSDSDNMDLCGQLVIWLGKPEAARYLWVGDMSETDKADHAAAAFIAASRTDVPALLAEVRALRAELQAARGSLEMAIRFVSHYGTCSAPAMSFTWLMREKCTCEQGRFAHTEIDAAIARIDVTLGGKE